MDENIYTTNVEMKPQKPFSRGFRFLLGLGIFLTGVVSIPGVSFVVMGIGEQAWKEMGMCHFVTLAVWYACILCCFVFMIKIKIDRTYFSKLLVRCVRIIGGMVTVSSFIFPRLSGYRDSGFEIMHFGSVTLIDGSILMIGVLLLIFAGIIKEGFSMQKELDEVL